MNSALYTASVAAPHPAPSVSLWPAFASGAVFGAGILAVFGVCCVALLAGDMIRRRAVARARLRRALADLDADDIVALIQGQHGEAG